MFPIKLNQSWGPLLIKCGDCAAHLATLREQEARIKELEARLEALSQLQAAAVLSDQPIVTVDPMPLETGWAHLKASVIGFKKPFLQDAHDVVVEGENVVLLVCDGAGSLRHSKEGADFVVKHLGEKFRAFIQSGEVLTKDSWSTRVRALFLDVVQALKSKSQADRLNYAEFGCTCIVVFAGPDFVACAHVGDGRAGYLDASGHWLALMTPHKGELANSTVFMTMLDASTVDQLVRVNFIPSRTRAVVALSDGPEDVCWQVASFNPSGQKVVDPNQPSNEFLGKIANQLAGAVAKQVPQEDLDKLWQKFLTEGSPKLKAQVDDKTMLLALRG